MWLHRNFTVNPSLATHLTNTFEIMALPPSAGGLIARAVWQCSPRSAAPWSAVTPVTYLRCGSNYPAPSSRNGELNAEGNSHAQDQHLRRCCCIVPDWRWSMDWRRNTDFDQCACWFDHRSILDYGECKEPRTTSIEPPVAKQASAQKAPGRRASSSIFRSISSGSLAIFAAIRRAS